MRKYPTQVMSVFVLCCMGLIISSCKDDDPPAAKPQLSFALDEITANEADGTLEVEVVLDKPATQDITIEYAIAGDAVDDATAAENENSDYEIVSEYLEVVIVAGETKGIIELDIYSDFDLEGAETIELSIEEVNSELVEITREDETVITVNQEDGIAIVLEWADPSAAGQADMDIIIRVGPTVNNWTGITGSFFPGVTGPEITFVPKATTLAAFGMSYTYYEGTLNPLAFTATFVDVVNGTPEPVNQRTVYNGSYTLANINKWEDPATTKVVQTFEKVNGAFTTPTEITTPDAGSRYGASIGVPAITLKKSQGSRVSAEIRSKFGL